jgi:hypothetical protein
MIENEPQEPKEMWLTDDYVKKLLENLKAGQLCCSIFYLTKFTFQVCIQLQASCMISLKFITMMLPTGHCICLLSELSTVGRGD